MANDMSSSTSTFLLDDLIQEGEFHGKYEPKEILGKGLSSTVRRCVSRETGLEYAVKIINRSQGNAIEESITAEVEILRSLPEHPNIIKLHDVFESPAYIFLVFELVNGGELFDFLTQSVRLSEKKTRQIMQQIFSAIEHLHQNNVIHRDLKPENILLDKQGNVRVTDFGFSIRADPTEELSDLLGTPGYLAPELLKRSVEPDAPGYNREIDIWACGVIMYTLLAGFPPFWHRKQLVMLRTIMKGKYEFVSPEWDEISDSAKDIIKKLLVLNPQIRFTASQALDHPFLQTKPTEFKMFSAARKLKAILLCIRFCVAVDRSRKTPKILTIGDVGSIPYENRYIRKLIDTCAFHIYSPWVKRGEEQNRAALFETTPKRPTKLSEDEMKMTLGGMGSPPISFVLTPSV